MHDNRTSGNQRSGKTGLPVFVTGILSLFMVGIAGAEEPAARHRMESFLDAPKASPTSSARLTAIPTNTPAIVWAESAPALVTVIKKAPGMVELGGWITNEMTLVAQADAADVVLRDAIPDSATLLQCHPPAQKTGGELTWNFPLLKRGETRVIRVTLQADAPGDLTTTARVTATPTAATTTHVGMARLEIRLAGSKTPSKDGRVTIEVRNTGNITARDVTLDAGTKQPLSIGDLPPGKSRTTQIQRSGAGAIHAVAAAKNAAKVILDRSFSSPSE